VEFALAIPFLALIIALTFLCGYVMSNKQHVIATSRYVAWSRYYGQPAPSDDDANAMFLDMKARRIQLHQAEGPTGTVQDAVAEADRDSPDAGDLLDDTIDGAGMLSWRVDVSAEFPSSIPLWQRFVGPRGARCVRDGDQWQRGQISYLQPIRDQFLRDLHDHVLAIQGGQPPDSPLGKLCAAIENIYSQQW
jgi:hypothetical protein